MCGRHREVLPLWLSSWARGWHRVFRSVTILASLVEFLVSSRPVPPPPRTENPFFMLLKQGRQLGKAVGCAEIAIKMLHIEDVCAWPPSVRYSGYWG